MSPLLSSCFIFIAIFRQVSPFLPPSFLPLARPLPHCYAGRVGPEKFPRRSPNFLLPAKAGVRGRPPASGSSAGLGAAGPLNPSASASAARVDLAGRTKVLGAAASAAPGHSVAKCSRPAGEDEEALRCHRPRNGCSDRPPPAALSSLGPSERAESRAPRERRGSRLASPPPARPPALCGALPGSEESAGTRALRTAAPAASSSSQSALQPHAGGRKKERGSGSREGSCQARAVERALRGSSETNGRIVSFHQAPRLWPPTWAQSSELENSLRPGFSPTFALTQRKLGSSLSQRSVGIFPCLPLTKLP